MNQPVSPIENFLEDDRSRCSLTESNDPRKTCSSESSKSECPQPSESHSKPFSKPPRSAQEERHPSKRSYQKSPTRIEEPFQRPIVGSKQPRKPIKATAQEEPKGGLQTESEPPGPYGAKDQSSKDKPKVKTKERPKSSERREPKPTLPESSEKKRRKSSHQTTEKSGSSRDAVKDNVVGSTLDQLPHSPRAPTTSRIGGTKPAVVVREDLHGDKFLLPRKDKKLLSPLRDCSVPQMLVVKVELALLSRIPQPLGKGTYPKRLEAKESYSMKKQDADKRSADVSSKSLKKRKVRVIIWGSVDDHHSCLLAWL